MPRERWCTTSRRAAADALAYGADVSKEGEVEAMFAAADALGPVAALVNNAGILGDMRRIDEHDAESLTKVLAINVVGPALCAKHAVLRMSTKHGGHGGAIVNVSSIAATSGGIPGMVAYSTSKGALSSFTIGPHDRQGGRARGHSRSPLPWPGWCRRNAVAPGMIVTDMTVGFADQVAQTVSKPVGRCGEPEEIAAAVAWLVSEDASGPPQDDECYAR